MSRFNIYSKETAPAASVELLAAAEKEFGFVPNLLGVMAESPATIKAYKTIGKIFDESSFSATERQVVVLAASRFNECDYCVVAHSVIAGMQKVPADVIEAIRSDQAIDDDKLEALRSFTTAVVEKRGWVSDDDIVTFQAAGFSKAQILEVIVGLSFKTLSNYVNHIAETPLDDSFAAQAWTPVSDRLAS